MKFKKPSLGLFFKNRLVLLKVSVKSVYHNCIKTGKFLFDFFDIVHQHHTLGGNGRDFTFYFWTNKEIKGD